jgi:hypothetical protein
MSTTNAGISFYRSLAASNTSCQNAYVNEQFRAAAMASGALLYCTGESSSNPGRFLVAEGQQQREGDGDKLLNVVGPSLSRTGTATKSDFYTASDKGKGIDREIHPLCDEVQGKPGGASSSKTNQTTLEPPPDLPLSERCPHTIDIIRKSLSSETAAFLFSLPRKPAALRGHSECTQSRCTANDTKLGKDDEYISAHWKKTCAGESKCRFFAPAHPIA